MLGTELGYLKEQNGFNSWAIFPVPESTTYLVSLQNPKISNRKKPSISIYNNRKTQIWWNLPYRETREGRNNIRVRGWGEVSWNTAHPKKWQDSFNHEHKASHWFFLRLGTQHSIMERRGAHKEPSLPRMYQHYVL